MAEQTGTTAPAEEAREVTILETIGAIDGYSDAEVCDLVKSVSDVMKSHDSKLRFSMVNSKEVKAWADFLTEYVSKKRPHLCVSLINDSRKEQLSKRRCNECRLNLPCFACETETPINIITDVSNERKKRIYFSCKVSHLCQKCDNKVYTLYTEMCKRRERMEEEQQIDHYYN